MIRMVEKGHPELAKLTLDELIAQIHHRQLMAEASFRRIVTMLGFYLNDQIGRFGKKQETAFDWQKFEMVNKRLQQDLGWLDDAYQRLLLTDAAFDFDRLEFETFYRRSMADYVDLGHLMESLKDEALLHDRIATTRRVTANGVNIIIVEYDRMYQKRGRPGNLQYRQFKLP